MTTHSSTHTRNNLASIMKEADDNREPIVITRSGKPPVVLLSMDEYESMEETLHLLSSPANHVHALIKTDTEPLSRIVKSWKTFTARQINLATQSSGSVWEREYHDRYISDLEHYHNAVAYIRNNPVKAKLCPTTQDWPYSSASPKA